MVQIHTDNSIGDILARLHLDTDRDRWRRRLCDVTSSDVEAALATRPGSYRLDKLLALVSPAAEAYLEEMARQSQVLTRQRFGRTIRLYAPLYLSSFCVNRCRYCGFNAANRFERTRLTIEEALADAETLAREGFRDILLVSSEDRTFITVEYLAELAAKLRERFSFIGVEIYQMSSDQYRQLFDAGIEGVTLYQETYDRDEYTRQHPGGPKADYDVRLRGPDDMARAGMREIGLGVLLGLADWRIETLALGEHASYLMRRYWRSHVSFSFPRLRPACGVTREEFPHLLSDRNLVQMMLALRLCFADAGLVLSTREEAGFRDHVIALGPTRMSAGSRTNPGGYTQSDRGEGQFEVCDHRSPQEVAAMLARHGLEPVWKDWDGAFLGQRTGE
ncbi:MAG TPA: 2-iminoacetate synthase ThiH [Sedimentisphaerales bacterium]|nr:2-iminoacetate synthase ThiH [Sedimentisphaerales bacterium]HRS10029.1 2-iminoacetate synthase ThiH [Sedimentisphaerales bacterium]HRV46735.1 2-iminoacetate synthase ThiH [Sedimentisphaerales bacterium]